MVTRISFLMMKIMYDRKRNNRNWDENGLVPREHKYSVLTKRRKITTSLSIQEMEHIVLESLHVNTG